jgi:hypothetical protein
MSWKRVAAVLPAAVGSAAEAVAHPGHGVGGGSWSLLHYLTEPAHWLLALLGLLAVTLFFRAARAARFLPSPRNSNRIEN